MSLQCPFPKIVLECITSSLVVRINSRFCRKASRTATQRARKITQLVYKTRVNFITLDITDFFFSTSNANSRSDKKQNATLRLERKKKTEIKFQVISFAILYNMNGVYLFYGLFRAEPTGGPKISSRRKRRTGRASE